MKSNVTSENDEYVEARTDWGEPAGGQLIAVMCESSQSASHHARRTTSIWAALFEIYCPPVFSAFASSHHQIVGNPLANSGSVSGWLKRSQRAVRE